MNKQFTKKVSMTCALAMSFGWGSMFVSEEAHAIYNPDEETQSESSENKMKMLRSSPSEDLWELLT